MSIIINQADIQLHESEKMNDRNYNHIAKILKREHESL